jgi:hypothetical protein
MNRQLTRCVLVSLAFAGYVSAAEVQPRLTVLLYDFAGIAPDVLAMAKRQTAKVYGSSGVEIDWIACAASFSKNELNPECIASRPDRLEIRLLPEFKTRLLHPRAGALGLALTSEKGGFGTVAFIFADRAKEMGSSPASAFGLILGAIVAHELGHLLLGPGGHSLDGIMKTAWGSPEIVRSLQRQLHFTDKQSERIRAQVLARMDSRPPGE